MFVESDCIGLQNTVMYTVQYFAVEKQVGILLIAIHIESGHVVFISAVLV